MRKGISGFPPLWWLRCEVRVGWGERPYHNYVENFGGFRPTGVGGVGGKRFRAGLWPSRGGENNYYPDPEAARVDQWPYLYGQDLSYPLLHTSQLCFWLQILHSWGARDIVFFSSRKFCTP